jgi:hypothetical protein
MRCAVRLDRLFGDAEIARNLLVEPASDDVAQDFALARRQSRQSAVD